MLAVVEGVAGAGVAVVLLPVAVLVDAVVELLLEVLLAGVVVDALSCVLSTGEATRLLLGVLLLAAMLLAEA
ncbi:MAG: hypothetical protein R3E93_00545 [Thiothrix sp.]